jgi:hypothetical protein
VAYVEVQDPPTRSRWYLWRSGSHLWGFELTVVVIEHLTRGDIEPISERRMGSEANGSVKQI